MENDFDDYVEEDTYDEIFRALAKKSNTLTHLFQVFVKDLFTHFHQKYFQNFII